MLQLDVRIQPIRVGRPQLTDRITLPTDQAGNLIGSENEFVAFIAGKAGSDDLVTR